MSIILRCVLDVGLMILVEAARRLLEQWWHHRVFFAGEDVDWLVLQVSQICNTTSLVLNQCALNRLMPVLLHIFYLALASVGASGDHSGTFDEV